MNTWTSFHFFFQHAQRFNSHYTEFIVICSLTSIFQRPSSPRLYLCNESSAMPLDIFPPFPLLFHESILNIYNAWAWSGLPLLNHSSLAAPSEVSSPFGDAEGRFLSSSSHTPPPLYDVTITHRCNKRRRDSPGRIPADVTPRLI